jgi:hypothetical protein
MKCVNFLSAKNKKQHSCKNFKPARAKTCVVNKNTYYLMSLLRIRLIDKTKKIGITTSNHTKLKSKNGSSNPRKSLRVKFTAWVKGKNK